MRNDDGFIYEEDELSDEEKRVLQGIKHDARVDPVTGRKAKQINILNKKKLSRHEMDEFFMDF